MDANLTQKYLGKAESTPRELTAAIEQDLVEEVMRLTQFDRLGDPAAIERLKEIATDLRQARSA